MHQGRRGGVRLRALAMAGALLTALGTPAASLAEDADVTKRINALEQELAELKGQLAAKNQADEAKAKAEEEKAKHAPVYGGGAEGFYVMSPDRENILFIRGYTQFDFRAVAGKESDTNPNTFAFRRIRPIFEGTLLNYIDFKIMPDFAGGAPRSSMRSPTSITSRRRCFSSGSSSRPPASSACNHRGTSCSSNAPSRRSLPRTGISASNSGGSWERPRMCRHRPGEAT